MADSMKDDPLSAESRLGVPPDEEFPCVFPKLGGPLLPLEKKSIYPNPM